MDTRTYMLRFLVDMVFPKICISCRTEGSHLCEDCFATVSIAQTLSPVSRNSALSGLFCAASYQDVLVQRLIHFFKYPPFVRGLALPLASFIIAHLALVDKPQSPVPYGTAQAAPPKDQNWLVCPIPLHKRRLRWRGFNHAEEIAKVLSEILEIPIDSNVLVRTKHAAPQVSLPQKERTQRMKGMFLARNVQQIRGKKVLLADDVYTTGATMEAAALALKGAGAKQVWGAVVARG